MVVALFAHTLFSEILGVTAEKNIGTTACHVGCNGYGVESARLCDYLGFARVVLRVEYIVLDTVAAQKSGNFLGLVYSYRTYKHGLSLCVALDNLVDDCFLFALYGRVNSVVIVETLYGAVGGDSTTSKE